MQRVKFGMKLKKNQRDHIRHGCKEEMEAHGVRLVLL